MTLQKLFLSFFGAGTSPKYPYITGISAAFLLGIAMLYIMGPETLFMLILAIGIIGIFEINKALNSHLSAEEPESHLGYEIIIDKAAGVWLSMLIPYTTAFSLSYPYAYEAALFFSLVSFCLFDRWGPSTIGWLRRNVKGGLGMMSSTVLAGFAGGFLTIVILLGIDKLVHML